MKLNELAVANPTKQAAQVFESYFGGTVNFDTVTPTQARGMLKRVRALIAEHRRTTKFHRSEQNPAYLKLVVMEQALASAATAPGAVPQANPQQQAAAMTLQRQQKQRQLDDENKQIDQQLKDLTARKAQIQQEKGMMENRLSRRLREASEVQQAQVVLASQDMVDQVQKMSEQISAMQFKDLPALVDQIKNEVGVDQAMQFNTDTTAALAGLLQNLQGAKTQLESALGVVTGQAPQVPGVDMNVGAELDAELPAELPEPDEEEIDTETDIEVDDGKDSNTLAASLGRGRR
jgi:DNA repair exonuclease SbcCD ATPase subunit